MQTKSTETMLIEGQPNEMPAMLYEVAKNSLLIMAPYGRGLVKS